MDDGPLKKRVQEIFEMWGFLKSLSEHLEIFLRSLSKEVFASFAKGLVCQLCQSCWHWQIAIASVPGAHESDRVTPPCLATPFLKIFFLTRNHQSIPEKVPKEDHGHKMHPVGASFDVFLTHV